MNYYIYDSLIIDCKSYMHMKTIKCSYQCFPFYCASFYGCLSYVIIWVLIASTQRLWYLDSYRYRRLLSTPDKIIAAILKSQHGHTLLNKSNQKSREINPALCSLLIQVGVALTLDYNQHLTFSTLAACSFYTTGHSSHLKNRRLEMLCSTCSGNQTDMVPIPEQKH